MSGNFAFYGRYLLRTFIILIRCDQILYSTVYYEMGGKELNKFRLRAGGLRDYANRLNGKLNLISTSKPR